VGQEERESSLAAPLQTFTPSPPTFVQPLGAIRGSPSQNSIRAAPFSMDSLSLPTSTESPGESGFERALESPRDLQLQPLHRCAVTDAADRQQRPWVSTRFACVVTRKFVMSYQPLLRATTSGITDAWPRPSASSQEITVRLRCSAGWKPSDGVASHRCAWKPRTSALQIIPIELLAQTGRGSVRAKA